MAELDPNFQYRQAATGTMLQGVQLGASIAERRNVMEMRRRELEQNIAQNIIQQNLQQAQADMYRRRVADEIDESEKQKRDAPKIADYQLRYSSWLQNPTSELPVPPPLESRLNQAQVTSLLGQADQFSARAQKMQAEAKAAAALERQEAELLNDAIKYPGAVTRDQNGRVVFNQEVYQTLKAREFEANVGRKEQPTVVMTDALSRAAAAVRQAVDNAEPPEVLESLKSQLESLAATRSQNVSYNEAGYPVLAVGVPATLRAKYTEAIDKSTKALNAIDLIESKIGDAFGPRAAAGEIGQRLGLANVGLGRTAAQDEVAQQLSLLTSFAARSLLDEKGAMSNADIERARELAGNEFLRSSPDQARRRIKTLRDMFTEAKALAESRLGGGGPQTQDKALDAATARQILQEAGGDKERARALARERGYKF